MEEKAARWKKADNVHGKNVLMTVSGKKTALQLLQISLSDTGLSELAKVITIMDINGFISKH